MTFWGPCCPRSQCGGCDWFTKNSKASLASANIHMKTCRQDFSFWGFLVTCSAVWLYMNLLLLMINYLNGTATCLKCSTTNRCSSVSKLWTFSKCAVNSFCAYYLWSRAFFSSLFSIGGLEEKKWSKTKHTCRNAVTFAPVLTFCWLGIFTGLYHEDPWVNRKRNQRADVLQACKRKPSGGEELKLESREFVQAAVNQSRNSFELKQSRFAQKQGLWVRGFWGRDLFFLSRYIFTITTRHTPLSERSLLFICESWALTTKTLTVMRQLW